VYLTVYVAVTVCGIKYILPQNVRKRVFQLFKLVVKLFYLLAVAAF
jgi:hypothetical protein